MCRGKRDIPERMMACGKSPTEREGGTSEELKECQLDRSLKIKKESGKQVLDETRNIYRDWNMQDFLNHHRICNLMLRVIGYHCMCVLNTVPFSG